MTNWENQFVPKAVDLKEKRRKFFIQELHNLCISSNFVDWLNKNMKNDWRGKNKYYISVYGPEMKTAHRKLARKLEENIKTGFTFFGTKRN
jgi:hypothetical protein